MDGEGASAAAGSCYYTVLGVCREASLADVRSSYRKLALKWHPDRNPVVVAADGMQRFQKIQEAYSVLSDQSKRSMYDAGLYDPLEEEDEDLCDFMQEMVTMMNNVKDEEDSLEDLQRMLVEIVGGGDGTRFQNPTANKRARGSSTTPKGTAAKRNNSRF